MLYMYVYVEVCKHVHKDDRTFVERFGCFIIFAIHAQRIDYAHVWL